MNNVSIPIMRNLLPYMFAQELVDVQPMSLEMGAIFNKLPITEPRLPDRFGDMSHFFAYGYKIFDGKEFIPLELFWENFPDLNYDYLHSMNNQRVIVPDNYIYR